MKNKYLGYSEQDLAESPYAPFFNSEIAPFQTHVTEAMLAGGQAHELMYGVERAAEMNDEGYWPIENGFARTPDGGIRVFCLTEMPNVTPAMWDWWFAWHGSEPLRYKLWHPKAHVHVGWKDNRSDLSHYVGRTSHIVEYLGSERLSGAINFVAPASLGLDETKLRDRGEVAVCARISFPNTPVKLGWLMHHLRPVPGGSEMRSRMWMGGANVALGDRPGPIARGLGVVVAQLARMQLPNPAELLAHNAQEMAHLAGFLPELYETFSASD
ncbi:MAG: hypothetical protein HOC23_24875 [Halieaceae bacterium]|nr:hypothetical protein [Halieaceae bacterium]